MNAAIRGLFPVTAVRRPPGEVALPGHAEPRTRNPDGCHDSSNSARKRNRVERLAHIVERVPLALFRLLPVNVKIENDAVIERRVPQELYRGVATFDE